MAITVDAIKVAYRQDKEGYLSTLRFHPQDDHDEFAKAPIGALLRVTIEFLDEFGNGPADNAAVEGSDVC